MTAALPDPRPRRASVADHALTDAEFGVITLIFVRDASAPGGLKLTHWVALDAQNNRTRVNLSNQRYGTAVADSTFTFKDPRRTARRPG